MRFRSPSASLNAALIQSVVHFRYSIDERLFAFATAYSKHAAHIKDSLRNTSTCCWFAGQSASSIANHVVLIVLSHRHETSPKQGVKSKEAPFNVRSGKR